MLQTKTALDLQPQRPVNVDVRSRVIRNVLYANHGEVRYRRRQGSDARFRPRCLLALMRLGYTSMSLSIFCICITHLLLFMLALNKGRKKSDWEEGRQRVCFLLPPCVYRGVGDG